MSEPDVQLCGLSIWVKGRPYKEASNHLDANWLEVCATMQSDQASVTTEGPILLTKDFDRFRNDLAMMNQRVAGEALLSGYDPNLKVTLKRSSLGQVAGEVEMSDFSQSEFHRFLIGGLDQTDLPRLIAAVDRVLERYPVLDWPVG